MCTCYHFYNVTIIVIGISKESRFVTEIITVYKKGTVQLVKFALDTPAAVMTVTHLFSIQI